MKKPIRPGDCVKTPDGRIGRVRGKSGGKYRIRVRRKTSNTHQFLLFDAGQLRPIDCPSGWMSPSGYNRYLKETLRKMRGRLAKQRAK